MLLSNFFLLLAVSLKKIRKVATYFTSFIIFILTLNLRLTRFKIIIKTPLYI